MRKLATSLFVLVLLISAVTPALAARTDPPGMAGKGVFGFSGSIIAIDPDSRTVTAHVAAGCRLVTIGNEITLQTTPDTRFLAKTAVGTIIISFEELKIDQPMSAQGVMTGGVWTADRITVRYL